MRTKTVAKILSAFALIVTLAPFAAHAQEEGESFDVAPAQGEQAFDPSQFPPDQFYRGKAVEIVETGTHRAGDVPQPYQITKIRLTSGPEKGKEIDIEHAGIYNKVRKGDDVVIVKVTVTGESEYYIADEYRLNALAIILALFLGVAVWVGRGKAFRSVLGLIFSIVVLAAYVMPKILAGANPLAILLAAAVVIAVVSMFLAHGFDKRTTVAFAATAVTLAVAAALAWAFVRFAHLFGLGSDEAAYLQLGALQSVDLRGLLLGGIIIGTLGVLDDVTTAQAAAIEELHFADKKFRTAELYTRGLSIGREHIASLVNTLALAYAGASLPLFLLFAINKTQPLWVILNSETIAEEAVRTIVGSIALVLAVPISTGIAAAVYGNPRKFGIKE